MTRTVTRTLPLAPAFALLLAASSGCPKDDGRTGATPIPSREDAATPHGSPGPTATMPVTSPSSWAISYRWSGGLSIYQYFDLTITGAETAAVVFKVKPLRGEEVTVEDTLSPAELGELLRLFDAVKFDEVGTQPRKVRVMDIGQTVIGREGTGRAKHEVMENPAQQASSDLRPLKQWFDDRVRQYLEEAGVAPGRR